MEFKSVRIALTLVLLLAILMVVFACNSGPDASRTMNADPTALSPSNPDLCRDTTNGDRVKMLNDRLMNDDMGDAELNNYRGNPQHFKFDASAYNTNTDGNLRVVVRVYGRVIGEDDAGGGNKEPKMQKLLKFLRKSMRKGCIDRVSFEPMPEASPAPTANTSEQAVTAPILSRQSGFEWQACPHPQFPCQPDGHCSTDAGNCKRDIPEPLGSPRPGESPSPSVTPSPRP